MIYFLLKNKRAVTLLSWSVLILLAIGCDTTDDTVVSQADLIAMNQEITTLSASVACADASDWSITAIGSKACGGPSGYITFSKKIDTVAFLNKVEKYTQASKAYNEENNIISDCAVEPIPIGVVCHDGEARLIFSRCELIPDAGPCDAAIPKYYFDQETQECTEFIWGGCDGTVPFETLEECQICQ